MRVINGIYGHEKETCFSVNRAFAFCFHEVRLTTRAPLVMLSTYTICGIFRHKTLRTEIYSRLCWRNCGTIANRRLRSAPLRWRHVPAPKHPRRTASHNPYSIISRPDVHLLWHVKLLYKRIARDLTLSKVRSFIKRPRALPRLLHADISGLMELEIAVHNLQQLLCQSLSVQKIAGMSILLATHLFVISLHYHILN